jgi:putative transposase
MPLIDERPLRDHTGTQPIGIANNFPHDRQSTAWTYPIRVPTSSASNNTIVHRDNYHVVSCPKYQRPVIGGRIEQHPRVSTFGKSATNEIHTSSSWKPCRPRAPLVSYDPQFGIHRLVKQIKGRSSRTLRAESPTLEARLPTRWTNSYFVATVGGAT